MFDIIKEILISEKEFTDINCDTQKNNLIDSVGNMYLTVDSLTQINDIITGSNNITLRKVKVETYGFAKRYMYKDLIEAKPYQIMDQFNEKQITC